MCSKHLRQPGDAAGGGVWPASYAAAAHLREAQPATSVSPQVARAQPFPFKEWPKAI